MTKLEDNKGKKILKFFLNGLKKTMSPNTESVHITKRIKERSLDIVDNLIDFFYIIFNGIFIVIYYIFGMFLMAKDIPHAFTRAAHNNFRLGLENLKKNNLVDARIRLLLSNLFYSKSPTTKYYIAYTYYRQGNFSKSLQYLNQTVKLDSKNERAIALIKQIETELKAKQNAKEL